MGTFLDRLYEAQHNIAYCSLACWPSDEPFAYLYSYNQAGRVTKQRLAVTPGGVNQTPANLEATYTWDNEGRMTSMTAPSGNPAYGDGDC